MKKFKKGDRVRVYATLNGVPAETKGTVLEIDSVSRLKIELEKFEKWTVYAHPKQCRKLRKRVCKILGKGKA